MTERSLTTHDVDIRVKNADLVRVRQDEIIQAALAVFHERGFHQATVREIGEAAGMSQGTLYNYIRTKEDILFLVCDRLVESYQSAVRAAVADEQVPEQRLVAALQAVVEVMQDHVDDVRLMYQESHALSHRAMRHVLGRVSGFIDFFVEILDGVEAPGGGRFSNPPMIANIITFLPVIVALRGWYNKQHSNPEETRDIIIAFMTRGLGLELPPSIESASGKGSDA